MSFVFLTKIADVPDSLSPERAEARTATAAPSEPGHSLAGLGWAGLVLLGGGWGDAAMVTTAGGSSVADVAYMHSDVAFLFPIVPEAAFGAELLSLAESGKTNLRGGAVQVHSVQTYPDALDMTKKAGPSAVVSIMTLAQGLPKMAANIRAASQQGQPLVVHVAGVEVADDFELHPSVGAAYELTDAGAAVVVAAGVLDCVDSAIYAYALADALRRPVIHLVDGPLGLSARSTAGLSWDATTSRIHAMHRQLGGSRPGMGPPLELGDFRALSYVGDRSARTVFVAVGTGISAARHAVEANSTLGLGLLAVQLLEPWHEDVSPPARALTTSLAVQQLQALLAAPSRFCGTAIANFYVRVLSVAAIPRPAPTVYAVGRSARLRQPLPPTLRACTLGSRTLFTSPCSGCAERRVRQHGRYRRCPIAAACSLAGSRFQWRARVNINQPDPCRFSG